MQKIKGGRWTVARFGTVSVAYTVAWMLISSLLGWYRVLYGPQILLLMNLAYFLPSIPLLVTSSLLDAWLEQRYGLARTILARLLVGLGGSIAICASFPFQPVGLWWLLGSVTALGLLSSIAFSASYQLVVHFANKNTISLGLGCAGSGVLVLLLESLLNVGAAPTFRQLVVLFGIGTGIIVLGFFAATSLLLRHWDAVEARGACAQKLEATAPLLEAEQGLEASQSRLVRRMTSLSPLLGISPLDFLEPGTERELPPNNIFSLASLAGRSVEEELGAEQQRQPGRGFQTRSSFSDLKRSVGEALRRVQSEKPASLSSWLGTNAPGKAQQAPHLESCPEREAHDMQPVPNSPFDDAVASQPGNDNQGISAEQQQRQALGIIGVALHIWPVMLMLFLCALACVICFPFFTYVPSSGGMGSSLPKVLFFTRLFADVGGRSTPRIRALALTSQSSLLTLASLALTTLPGFFVYIKILHWHNDFLVTGYVIVLWFVAGYLNTCAYVAAPQCVPTAQKPMANALLALASQIAHCTGLVLAVVLAFSLYGDIAG